MIDLPRHASPCGSITPIEGGVNIPFAIARVYYLYDIPGGAVRGGHAHVELEQVLAAVLGAFDIVVDDGSNKKVIRLDRAYRGLFIPRGIWREMVNFSSGAVCVVLASTPYRKDDYLRDYETFSRMKVADG